MEDVTHKQPHNNWVQLNLTLSPVTQWATASATQKNPRRRQKHKFTRLLSILLTIFIFSVVRLLTNQYVIPTIKALPLTIKPNWTRFNP